MLEPITEHLDIISAQDSIIKNCEHRRTFKERIQNAKLVTGGEIFRNGYSRLGQNILEVQRERKEASQVKQEGEYKKNIK